VRSIGRRKAVETASPPWCRNFDGLWRSMPGSETDKGDRANALLVSSSGLVAGSMWKMMRLRLRRRSDAFAETDNHRR